MAPPKKPRASRKAWRIALWTLAIPPALCVLLLIALTIAGWWVERVYLQKELVFVTMKSVDGVEDGEFADTTSVRVHGARFDWWKLNVHADSIWFRSPSLDARSGETSVRIDWVDGITALRPAARLDIDSLWVRLRADTTVPEKKPLDSLAFPDFSLPIAARVVVRGARVDDDSSRSLGFVARARGITVRSRGGERAQARIGRAETRWTGDLVLASTATLDWSDADSVDLRADVRRDLDKIRLTGRHAKRPLWKGHDSLSLDIRDAAPYYKAFGIGDQIPGLGEVRLRAAASLGDSVAMTLRAHGAMKAWRVNPDFTLGPQSVNLSATWNHDRGTVTFTSAGTQGEDIRVAAEGRLLTPPKSLGALPDSGRVSPPFREQVAATLRGHARGLQVKVRDTLRTADVTIEKATWDGRNLALALVTGDSSRVEAAGMLAGAARHRRATFGATIHPEERWLKVFIGESVTFTGLTARGEYRNELVTATVAAHELKAYGFALDSVRTVHAYSLSGKGGGTYTLKPSRLHAGKDVWTLSGTLKAVPPKARAGNDGIDLDASLTSPGRGTLRYTLAPDGTMEGTANAFEATALPYMPIDSIPLRDAILDGTFRWNPARKTGFADLKASGLYAHAGRKAEAVEVKLSGDWNPRLLTLREATVGYRGSDLTARARLRMENRQFWEAGTVPPGGYEFAAVETGRFNLADILAAFLPEPPLEKGILRGGLAFSDTAGFAGTLTFEDIALRDPPGDVLIADLRVAGRGDSLHAYARTESPTFPLLNDTLQITLTGARADTQHVLLNLTADKTLRLRLNGVMHRFGGLRGTLAAQGSARFPDGAGSLEALDVAMTFNVPFEGGLEVAMLKTETFTGAYANTANERQPRQRFSLDPQLQGGTLKVSRLRIENDQGQALTGSLEYNPAKGVLNVKADGARFAAQWTDDYSADLRDLHLEYHLGPEGGRARASFSSGTFLYSDPPLRIEGRLTAMRANYVRPPPPSSGKRSDRAADTLRVSGILQESEVRHKLRSLGDIQRLIRRNERRRPGAGAPLLLDVKVRTLGTRNQINSDILRLTWVGDFAMRGIHPYTLLEGRVNTLKGSFGLEREAYDIRRLDVKWLNAPVEEGEIHMEARKSLARSCTPQSSGTTDSCTVITRLDGTLNEMLFSYDSDCGGAFGAGANVAAILYSVQRGCYDASITAGDGSGYGERALTLLEPTISRSLSQVVGRYSGAWIEVAEITGLGSLSPDGTVTDTLGQALSLALTSREYQRLRLKIRSGYHTASQDLSNPWEHMLALEWRPPLPASLRDSLWRQRLRDNLRVAASVQTRPVRQSNPEADEIEKKIDLHYNHVFWGEWWAKKKTSEVIKAQSEREALEEKSEVRRVKSEEEGTQENSEKAVPGE